MYFSELLLTIYVNKHPYEYNLLKLKSKKILGEKTKTKLNSSSKIIEEEEQPFLEDQDLSKAPSKKDKLQNENHQSLKIQSSLLKKDPKQNSSKNNLNESEEFEEVQHLQNNLGDPTKISSTFINEPISNKKSIDWKKICTNFIVLLVTVVLTLTLMNTLSAFLSLIGNFVGIFEIFVFPFLMIIILNRKKKIISNCHLVSK